MATDKRRIVERMDVKPAHSTPGLENPSYFFRGVVSAILFELVFLGIAGVLGWLIWLASHPQP